MTADLEPSEKADGVLGLMLDRDDIQRTILEETLASEGNGQILESGRTLCSSPSDIKGPLERFPRAVDLQRCPITGMGGAWHTHVTPEQLLNPQNSLPDIGSVVFGQLDVIAVVGAESAEYVVAAEDQDVMVREFRDAVGADIDDPGELVAAVQSGRVNPRTANRRVRQRMGDMFIRDQTGFSDIAETVKERHQTTTAMQQPYEAVELSMIHAQTDTVQYSDAMSSPSTCNQMTGQMATTAEQTLSSAIPDAIKGPAIGAAVGTVVGNVINSLFFSE